jgi:hypothetical protein
MDLYEPYENGRSVDYPPFDQAESDDEYVTTLRQRQELQGCPSADVPALQRSYMPGQGLGILSLVDRIAKHYNLAQLRKMVRDFFAFRTNTNSARKHILVDMMARHLETLLKLGLTADFDRTVDYMNKETLERFQLSERVNHWLPFRPLSSYLDGVMYSRLCDLLLDSTVEWPRARPLIQGNALTPLLTTDLILRDRDCSTTIVFDSPLSHVHCRTDDPNVRVGCLVEEKRCLGHTSHEPCHSRDVFLVIFKCINQAKLKSLHDFATQHTEQISQLLTVPLNEHLAKFMEKDGVKLEPMSQPAVDKQHILESLQVESRIKLVPEDLRPTAARRLNFTVENRDAHLRSYVHKSFLSLNHLCLNAGNNRLTIDGVGVKEQGYFFQLVEYKYDEIEYARRYGSSLPKVSLLQVKQTFFNRKNDSDDIESLDFTLSLRCPISMMRMQEPVRGKQCEHLQCCEYTTIKSFIQNGQYKCPTCNKLSAASNLVVDDYMQDIIRNTADDVFEVIVDAKTGAWRVKEAADGVAIDDENAREPSFPKIPRLSEAEAVALEFKENRHASNAAVVDLDSYVPPRSVVRRNGASFESAIVLD